MVADKAGSGRSRAVRALLLGVVVVVLSSACAQAPAEQRLRERIADMQAAVEGREPGAFMEGVAPNFIGDDGLDRRGLRGMLAAQMVRNAEIGASLGPLQIAIEGDQARVEFQLVLTGGRGGLLPERARAWSVHSGWRDGDDGWQVVTAEWSPLGG